MLADNASDDEELLLYQRKQPDHAKEVEHELLKTAKVEEKDSLHEFAAKIEEKETDTKKVDREPQIKVEQHNSAAENTQSIVREFPTSGSLTICW